MQKSNVDFYPVLLLSILADTLLRLHTCLLYTSDAADEL